ncbi:MAG: CHAT domain-containing protein [Pseudonocardiaceae bacterium]
MYESKGGQRVSEFSREMTNEVDRRMALAREWDELVEQVRKLDGFEDFLRSPTLRTLLPAAVGGPIAIVNVSRWRCDALVVTTDGVRPRELPELTLQTAVERANTYLHTLQDAEQAAVAHDAALAAAQDAPSPATIREQVRAAQVVLDAAARTDAMLRETQEWMWDTIASTVLDELGLTDVPPSDGPWPRMWWCPTGPLTLLPLHTAGYHAATDVGTPRTVIDRVVSSYTPTVRALLEARTERPDGNADSGEGVDRDRMLLVTVKDVPGQPTLHAVDHERAVLQALMAPERCTPLEGPAATRDAVDRELPAHRWVHFSCHGDQNLAEPSLGGLLLHGSMLTVADITAREFHGDFAGLSACKTAVGGVDLLDEAITLAAALHYTGYRHVVASLWSVESTTSAEVFEALYGDLIQHGRLDSDNAALALHRAVRTIRGKSPDEPRLWTPFTHTGP